MCMSLFLDSILVYNSVCLSFLQNHTVWTTVACIKFWNKSRLIHFDHKTVKKWQDNNYINKIIWLKLEETNG